MGKPIQVGDTVTINFNDSEGVGILEDATVLHVPSDTGDWWYIEYIGQGDGVKRTMGINPMSASVESIVRKEE